MAKRDSKSKPEKPSCQPVGDPATPGDPNGEILRETPEVERPAGPVTGDGCPAGPDPGTADDAIMEEPPQPAEMETTPADGTPPVPPAVLTTQGAAKLAPRAALGDAFEQNPLSGLREAVPEGSARRGMDDGTRVREALRSVIEEGESLKEAAREWNVAPSTIAEWRARYQELLSQDERPGTPLMEIELRPQVDSSTYIPEAAREIFLENWDRLVTETAAQPADFVQSPRQVFLQTSPLTSWLFEEGQLDRSILAGVISALVGLVILTSFLMADRNPPVAITPPEPPPRDDLVIEAATAVAQSFFQAATWEERLKWVRQPEAVRAMMAAYYQNYPDGPVNDAALSLAMPLRNVVNLSFEIPSLNRQHFLCVLQTKGRYLVDWESSSLYQEDQLNRLRASRSTEPTRIAVTVRKSAEMDYFNYAFSDASKWECYQLGYPGLNLSLFGYAVKDSSDAISLNAMLGIIDHQAAVLEVRFPPGAPTDNQVEIISVLRGEWVPSD